MCHDMLYETFESNITPGMIAVVMCVEKIFYWRLAFLLQFTDKMRRCICKLRIHYNNSFVIDHKTDRASTFSEHTDLIGHHMKHPWRRSRSICVCKQC